MRGQYLLVIFIICFTTFGNALECYVCKNQEGNREKCLNAIITCEQNEDVCLTDLAWGSAPYWREGPIKQYYVSKNCSTQSKCRALRSHYMKIYKNVMYLEYEDWRSADCCKGDRCNYYIISSANTYYGVSLGSFLAVMLIPILSAWIW